MSPYRAGGSRAQRASAAGRRALAPAPFSRRCRGVRAPAPTAGRAPTTARPGRARRPGSRCRGPSSSASRRSSCGASSRTWVAHAVESARTVEHPVGPALRAAVGGDVGADDLRPATHDPADGDVVLPAVLGHQPVDRGGQRLRVAVVRMRPGPGLSRPAGRPRAVRPLAAGSPDAPWRGRRPWPARAATGPGRRPDAPPRRRPDGSLAGCRTRLVLRRHGAPSPPTTSTRDPAQRCGDVGRHRRGDQHLLGRGHQLGQPLATRRVELGEDVVEDQHRLAAVGPSAGRRTPGAAPARRTRTPRARRTPWPASGPEVEPQVVAMRTDQGDAALDLRLAAGPASPRAARRRRLVAVGHELARRGPARTGRPVPPVAPPGRDLVVGLGRPAARDRSTRASRAASSSAPARGQVAVPDVQRRQVAGAPARRDGQAGGLEQSVALLEDSVVVGAYAGQPGLRATSRSSRNRRRSPGSPLTSARSSGAKSTVRSSPSDLAGAGDRRAVDPRPVGPARVDLDLDQRRAGRRARPRPEGQRARRPAAPAARPWRPGGWTAWRRTRSPRPGWSCPARWDRRTRSPPGRAGARPRRRTGSRSARGARRARQPDRRTGISR